MSKKGPSKRTVPFFATNQGEHAFQSTGETYTDPPRTYGKAVFDGHLPRSLLGIRGAVYDTLDAEVP